MNKAVGAAAILFSCFFSALRYLHMRSEKILQMQALGKSLLELRSELAERRRNLGDIFYSVAGKNGIDRIKSFYEGLHGKLCDLGERGFSEIWREEAGRCFAPLGRNVEDLLFPLGEYLGGSELERQCAALEKAAFRLEEECQREKETLKREKKLRLGLSLSGGAFLVIMLL